MNHHKCTEVKHYAHQDKKARFHVLPQGARHRPQKTITPDAAERAGWCGVVLVCHGCGFSRSTKSVACRGSSRLAGVVSESTPVILEPSLRRSGGKPEATLDHPLASERELRQSWQPQPEKARARIQRRQHKPLSVCRSRLCCKRGPCLRKTRSSLKRGVDERGRPSESQDIARPTGRQSERGIAKDRFGPFGMVHEGVSVPLVEQEDLVVP